MNFSTSARLPHTLNRSLVGRLNVFNCSYAALCESNSIPSRAPTPCTTTDNGREAVTRGSFCRNDPAAPFRGFAKSCLPASSKDSLSSLNAWIGKKTSPRTSMSAGNESPFNWCGRFLMVFTFNVTSSPVTPLPRVKPRTRTPFS